MVMTIDINVERRRCSINESAVKRMVIKNNARKMGMGTFCPG